MIRLYPTSSILVLSSAVLDCVNFGYNKPSLYFGDMNIIHLRIDMRKAILNDINDHLVLA